MKHGVMLTAVKNMKLRPFGFSIPVRPWKEPIDKNHPVIATVHKHHSLLHYNSVHRPLVIGEVWRRDRFSFIPENEWGNGWQIDYCPIKLPGMDGYRIPKELDQFDEVIAQIASYEHHINPHVKSYYAYLSVNQDIVEANKYQGKQENQYMSDGFRQRGAGGPIMRCYMVYDRVPEKFCCQPFRHDSIYECNAKEENVVMPERYSIIAYNGYAVHKPSTVNYTYCRTRLTVAYDTLRYSKIHNNPMFD
jgi:hypothetical protein